MTKSLLRVVSKSATFRRAGYQFTAEPTDIPVEDLTKVQRSAIESDPQLVAFLVEEPDDKATTKTEEKPAAKSSAATTAKK